MQAAARAALEPMRANSFLAPPFPPLLEHTATETARAVIKDQVLVQDLQARGDAACRQVHPRLHW